MSDTSSCPLDVQSMVRCVFLLGGFETLSERWLDLLYAEHAILFIHCHGAAESSCDVRPTSSSSGSVMSYSEISACSVYGFYVIIHVVILNPIYGYPMVDIRFHI